MNPKPARISLMLLALAAIVGFVSPVSAARDVTLHVEVTDPQTGEFEVRLNMPLKSVDALLDVLEEELDAELNFAEHGEKFRAVKKIYLAVRDEDLSDFLEMKGDDGEYLKLWKDREAFRAEARDEGGDETAHLYIPLSVLDALFAGDVDEPNLKDALRELRSLAPLTLLSVDSKHKQVRVWLE